MSDKVNVLKVKRLRPDAILPTRADSGSSGWDLYSSEDIDIWAGDTEVVSTNIAFGIPVGYEIQVRSRSGLAVSTGIHVLNSPGTVDQSYTGECRVILHNSNRLLKYRIKKGDRIAQAVLSPVPEVELLEVDELGETERGNKGFGSSGV